MAIAKRALKYIKLFFVSIAFDIGGYMGENGEED